MKKLLTFGGIIISIVVVAMISQQIIFRGDKTEEKLTIAATIFPVYDIAKNIAGDNAEVINILPPGASPHTFELKPSDIVKLQPVKIIFNIGHHLDNWVNNVTASLPQANIKTVDSGIVLMQFQFDHEHEEDEHEEDETDPHYWLSIKNTRIIATTIAESLIALDPENQESYSQNLATYLEKLDSADAEIRLMLESLPQKNLIVFHEAWNYFANEYGLSIVAVFAPSPGKEPTPQYLKELYDVAEQSKVKAVFSEPQLSDQTLRPLIKDLGLTLFILDPLGGIDERSSHIANLIYNAKQISQAFNQ